MVTMTNGRMAHLLSVRTHREEYPGVRWIEERIRAGSANSDYGTSCVEVIEEVTVRFIEEIAYEVDNGEVVSVICGYKADRFFEDRTRPKKEEIDLLELCEESEYRMLQRMCRLILDIFNHPHSCSYDYHIRKEPCSGSGCDSEGPVNYHGGRGWQYFCGGSPRCCP